MLVLFFNNDGVVYHYYVDEGQTVNGPKYVKILGNVNVALHRKRPRMIQQGVLLLHNNAPLTRLHWLNNFLYETT